MDVCTRLYGKARSDAGNANNGVGEGNDIPCLACDDGVFET